MLTSNSCFHLPQLLPMAVWMLTVLAAFTSSVSLRAQSPAVQVPAAQVPASPATSDGEKTVKEPAAKVGWKPLLKADSLDGWEVTEFGGQGEVTAADGQIVFEMGDPLTGITYKGKEFPKTNFEIRLEAKRIQGNDFLCGLTFPVGERHASMIAGGWGGGVIGLSSVDGNDASENSTSSYQSFKNGQWYSFRVRVDDENVTGWVDDERVFQQERKGRDFGVRAEVLSSRPLGFCVFQSKVAIKGLEWRSLEKESAASETDKPKPAIPAVPEKRQSNATVD